MPGVVRVESFVAMMLSMSPDDGSQRRALLQGSAGEIFREVVKAGALPYDDPRLSEGHESHDDLGLLIDLGLLRDEPEAGGWVAADPATVQTGVVAPLGRQVVQLLDESAAWADVLSGLGQSFRRTPPSGDGKVTEIRGLPNINRFLDAAVDDAETSLLTAQPAGARRAAVLEQAVDRDIRALQRGVRMRTLYQHTARRSKATREHVARTMELGAQVRTLDEFFNRLILIDGRLAIIPGDQPEMALAIHEPGIVSYLADVFERSWERARDYEDRGRDLGERHRGRGQAADRAHAHRGPQRPGERQAGRRQHPDVRVLRRRAQGGVRRGDPLPARLRDGQPSRERGLRVTPAFLRSHCRA